MPRRTLCSQVSEVAPAPGRGPGACYLKVHTVPFLCGKTLGKALWEGLCGKDSVGAKLARDSGVSVENTFLTLRYREQALLPQGSSTRLSHWALSLGSSTGLDLWCI
ncbi:hypothetical protein EMIT0P228_250018 [Pseudomonas brassicacearum]